MQWKRIKYKLRINNKFDLSSAQNVAKQALQNLSSFKLVIYDSLHLSHQMMKFHQPLSLFNVLGEAPLHMIPALPQSLWHRINH